MHVARQVFVLRCRNLRAFLRTLQAQLALVVALVQIAEVGLKVGALDGLPATVTRSDRGPILGHGELRIGRRYAVISSAFISSTFDWSDFSTGFAASNLAFTCSQVRPDCVGGAGKPGMTTCAS